MPRQRKGRKAATGSSRPPGCADCGYTGWVRAEPVTRVEDGKPRTFDNVSARCRCQTPRPEVPARLGEIPKVDRQSQAAGEREE